MTGRGRLFIVSLAAIGLLSPTACKKAIVETSRTAYIVGPTRDIMPVDREAETRLDVDVLSASVMIATRLGNKRLKFCSGTLVEPASAGGNYRVLSNHHCFAETDAEDKATPKLLPEACTFTKVYFGYLPGKTKNAFVSGCEAGTLRTNFDGDLSVFTLSVNPPVKHKPLALYEGSDAGAGRSALIVHYPDVEERMEVPPEGGTKLPTAAVTLDDCKVLGEFDVSEWKLDRTLPFSLRHSCDLIHGSSGSGLIDVQTGALLGVNWGGIKISYADDLRTDNVATKASYVAAFLANKVEAEVAAVETRREADAVAATKGRGEVDDKSRSVADSLKSGCGVAGVSSGRGAALLLLLALLAPFLTLTPALALARRRARK
jgi:hypothetical protein